jgi:hypothetical protein
MSVRPPLPWSAPRQPSTHKAPPTLRRSRASKRQDSLRLSPSFRGPRRTFSWPNTGAISVPCAPRPPSSSPCQPRVASRSWAMRLSAGQEAWACHTAVAARMTLARPSPSLPSSRHSRQPEPSDPPPLGWRLAAPGGIQTLTPAWKGCGCAGLTCGCAGHTLGLAREQP